MGQFLKKWLDLAERKPKTAALVFVAVWGSAMLFGHDILALIMAPEALEMGGR